MFLRCLVLEALAAAGAAATVADEDASAATRSDGSRTAVHVESGDQARVKAAHCSITAATNASEGARGDNDNNPLVVRDAGGGDDGSFGGDGCFGDDGGFSDDRGDAVDSSGIHSKPLFASLNGGSAVRGWRARRRSSRIGCCSCCG